MRGDNSTSSTATNSALNADTVATPTTSVTSTSTPNLSDNTATASAPGSIVSWCVMFLLVAVWAGVRKSEKVQTALEPNKILDALCDVFSLALIAGVGLKGLHILFTKLAAMKIPVLSKVAGFALPIYS